MRRRSLGVPAAAVIAVLLGAVACDEETTNPPTPVAFDVTITNTSGPGTLDTPVANGAVPLSPGVWAVFSGANPAFTPGEDADLGTERIAEDGFVSEEDQDLDAAANVAAHGTFDAPGGNVPAIEPGESATFTISGVPGERFTFETMFVQSNDYFYAFDGDGIELFVGDAPVSGDVTAQVRLWDAGTEVDGPLGGPNQKLSQDPSAVDVGPDEDEAVRLVSETQAPFTLPSVSSVLQITIVPVVE